MPACGLEVKEEVVGRVLVLRLSGELDVYTAETFRQRADQAVRDSGARVVVLALRQLAFLDSTGLGAILGRYRWLQERGGRMAAAGAGGRVKAVLEVSGVSRLIPLFDSERKALAALGGETGGEVA
ncbi:MAG: anti-sigma factor antagonist [Bacillota bacterium]|nr:anti-sigma factor antagonist [Bacillota bacterium]